MGSQKQVENSVGSKMAFFAHLNCTLTAYTLRLVKVQPGPQDQNQSCSEDSLAVSCLRENHTDDSSSKRSSLE